MKSYPPVLLVYGDDEAMIQHTCKQVYAGFSSVHPLNLDTMGESLSFSLFGEPMLFTLDGDQTFDPTPLLDWEGPSTVLIVASKAKGPLLELIKKIPSGWVKVCNQPKPWETEERAIRWAVQIAKEHGKVLDEKKAHALVSLFGSHDLGQVSMEVLKAAIHADEAEIKGSDIKATLSPVNQADISGLIEAIKSRSIMGFMRNVDRLESEVKDKSELAMKTASYLGVQLVKWAQVALLLEQGESLSEVCNRIGANEYAVKKSVFPILSRWKKHEILKMIRVIGETQTSVKSGQIFPWGVFVSGMLLVFGYSGD